MLTWGKHLLEQFKEQRTPLSQAVFLSINMDLHKAEPLRDRVLPSGYSFKLLFLSTGSFSTTVPISLLATAAASVPA